MFFTWNDNIRFREIVSKIFVNFIKIPLHKCGIMDAIQTGIQTSIWDCLSYYFISINMFGP